MSLSPEERRGIKQNREAKAKSGVAYVKKEDQKHFKNWYAVSKGGRESSKAVQWIEALAEWPAATVDIDLQPGEDNSLDDSDDEDFPFDSLESTIGV